VASAPPLARAMVDVPPDDALNHPGSFMIATTEFRFILTAHARCRPRFPPARMRWFSVRDMVAVRRHLGQRCATDAADHI
jgi:hypothetical protein